MYRHCGKECKGRNKCSCKCTVKRCAGASSYVIGIHPGRKQRKKEREERKGKMKPISRE
jgi:hypothetical protein